MLVLITGALAAPLTGLEIEQDPRSMTSTRPELRTRHQQFLATFGSDEALFLSVTPPQLLSKEGLELVAKLSERIQALPEVERVLSLATAPQLVAGRYGAELAPLYGPQQYGKDWPRALVSALEENPQYQELLISEDMGSAGILIRPVMSAGPDTLPRLIDAVRQLTTTFGEQAKFHLTGVAVQKHDVVRLIRRDQRTVLPLVAVVLAVMLGVLFRHLSGVLLPLAVTGVSLVWTMGLYALAGLELNTISALLPPVVMILSVSNAVHLYNGWLLLPQTGEDHISVWRDRVDELLTPCSFTALTTALGLLSLTVSDIPAVRHFGLFGAAGVVCSLLVSLTLVPVCLSFFRVPEHRFRSGHGAITALLGAIANVTIRRPLFPVFGALLVTGLAVAALPELQNNTRLTGFLRDDAELAVASHFVDRRFGGINSLEFMISRSDGKPLTHLADYQALEQFEKAALDDDGVGKAYSLLQVLRPLQRAENNIDELALPSNDDELNYLLELLDQPGSEDLKNSFLSEDRKTARVNLLLHDVGSRQALDIVEDLQGRFEALFNGNYQVVPTGSYYQVILDSDRLVGTMLKSFGLSLTMVVLAILVLLRSFRLTVLAVIPNVIPVVWTLGIMGWLGIDLSTGTMMIGAVAFGLAVDDTIHYLVGYRRLQDQSSVDAVRTCTTRIGRALLISTLVLVLGFWTGSFGSFKPTIYFSLLVGTTLIGALICDLLVLPATLILWGRERGECLR